MNFILLSTYNGARFLGEQLDSLLAQSSRDWVLLVRDDGSSDGTLDILRRYAARDERIRLVAEPAENLGAARSFGALLQQALAEGGQRFMFCDQDDVWDPSKVEQSLVALDAGGPGPVIVHTDLEVVDSSLNLIAPSFFDYMHFRALPNSESGFRGLCVQNFFTGCTMAIDRSAAQMALPIPSGIYMHDWWIALTTGAAGGKFVFIDQPLIKYRQHDANVEGGRGGFWGMMNPFSVGFRKRLQVNARNFDRMLCQLDALVLWMHSHPGQLADANRRTVSAILEVFSAPPWSLRRLKRIVSSGVRRQDSLRTLLLVGRLWRTPRGI